MPEKYVCLAEVRDLLGAESEKRTISVQQRSALDHAQAIAGLSYEDTAKLVAELRTLKFMTDYTSCKIADLLPRYPEDVRAIFAKERVNLETGDINNVIDIVGKYL
jgi:DNA-directed RNA polymerase subunit F